MKTQYTDAILYHLKSDEPDKAMMEWLVQQPLIDQPDIFREFKNIVEERLAQRGIHDFDFSEMDNQIAVYEEAILTEKLEEAKLVMAQQELDKQMLIVDETVAGVRRYVMDCIINNEDNAEAMKELAAKLIASEKENDIYDEDNWKDIL